MGGWGGDLRITHRRVDVKVGKFLRVLLGLEGPKSGGDYFPLLQRCELFLVLRFRVQGLASQP